jgi:hypothetical protein
MGTLSSPTIMGKPWFTALTGVSASLQTSMSMIVNYPRILKSKIFEIQKQCFGGSGFNQVSGSGSGSRRAKMAHTNRKKVRNSCFEVLDVLL